MLDISDPVTPVKIGSFDIRSENIIIKDDYAYLAACDSFKILNISNPEQMEEAGSFRTNGCAQDVALQGDYAYLASGYGGLQIINISNPENPEQIGVFDIEGDGTSIVAVQGEYAYVKFDSLVVLDISDPTNPQHIGSFDSYVYAIAVQGDYVYITRNNVFCVLDNSDPANLVEIGSYTLDDYCFDIVIHNNYAYVANERAGLIILDISDPANIIKTGFFDTGDDARGVAVDDNYVYVADGDDGIYIIRNNELDNTKIENNENNIPQKVKLSQNYPNPFNPTTTFKYELPKESKVHLVLYDINGRLIETFVNEKQQPGYYSVQWNASQYSSGVYIYRIQADGFSAVKKCLLIK
ncbi:MAG: T9SS type A sorting domain-containing protein [Candidatus Marinimicrobia bacterium]|nr:T9SS type A sorting domain-containing protein [Candidatus Neomarinimicrobiota bacterium]